MFASRSVLEHVVRGGLGGAALVAAFVLSPAHPLALTLLPVGFVLLRGCPTCWLIGLFETLAAKVGARPRESACRDGRCGERSDEAAARQRWVAPRVERQ